MPRLAVFFAIAALCLPACKTTGGHESERIEAPSAGLSFGAIWDDPQRCAQQVSSGRRLTLDEGKLRVGTWNVRWFPDGVPGVEPGSRRTATNVPWLACTIAYLNADILGIQEIKLTEPGRAALKELTGELNRLTGAEWKWVADGCPKLDAQHILLLYRADRVELSEVVSHGEMDASAKADGDPACPGALRPGLGGYVKSKRGGVDFHFVSTHLDSGHGKLDFRNRRVAWDSIEKVRARRAELVPDEDFIIAADFNLMGCGECGLPHSWAELAVLREELGKLAAPLTAARLSQRCTQYTKGEGTVIDIIAHTRTMVEAEGAPAEVSGICAASKCKGLPPKSLPMLTQISDHCPVVMDIRDEDLDEGP